MNTESQNKMVVGNSEWCAFPELGIPAVKARVDSGAKTSAIHAFNIHSFKRSGQNWVSFEIHPIQKDRTHVVRCEAPVADRRMIKSSNGERERRYVIQTMMQLGSSQWPIEMTLTNRDTMGFRMLLGREAMNGRMLVDPEASNMQGDHSCEALKEMYQSTEHQESGLRIAVLASNPDLYSNQRLMEAGSERGHQMEFLNIRQCYMRIDAVTPEVHYRGGSPLPRYDAVITRIRPSITYYGCALTRQFESMGIQTFNTSTAITQSRDKLFSLQLLLRNGINIPTTGFANSPMETEDLIDMVGGAPLVVKLLEGAQGRGVFLAETRNAAESVINAFKSLQANLLVQEFVKEAEGRDLRCFVIDGKVVAAIERKAAPGDFRANLHQGGSASIVKLTPDEKKLAIKAAKTLGLHIAGVDIIRSRKGPLLLEVNSSPGLEGVESATGKDIAGLIISGIEKKLSWKRELNITTNC